ncbi:CLUMA_CG005479, isoform A [Clunio marinus]|uniref:CLUMA_CG005479, isoform A n=1 Tax=Clunio marinus TaxID=568069 RepID=A0A1J1HWD9_9DIPT|nr:CLUMA_CG005479, isoform A [Clunio marinus]
MKLLSLSLLPVEEVQRKKKTYSEKKCRKIHEIVGLTPRPTIIVSLICDHHVQDEEVECRCYALVGLNEKYELKKLRRKFHSSNFSL